jgi:cell division protein FtsI (penicillin-binding protein 3)
MGRASSGRRLRVMLAAYLAVTLIVGYRLVNIQVLEAEQFRGMAARQVQREVALHGDRGRIYDRAGEPLAMSLAAATVYAHPRELGEVPGSAPVYIATRLSPILDRPVPELTAALTKDASFVYLARQVPRSVGEQVEGLRLPGIGVLEESRRVYPSDGLGAQVVGFAGVDGKGLSGLELSLDETLAGTPGTLRLERAPRGLEISTAPREVVPPEPGTDVVLTLDREIQAATEEVLSSAVDKYAAEGGSAVVMDANSGEILAMASMPTFSHSDVGDADEAARRNRAVTDIFEPGSVNKVITTSGAIEDGKVTPNTVFDIPDAYELGGKVFHDSHEAAKPALSVSEILETSSNIGTIRIAEQLGPDRLYDWLRKFGYGETTGLGFPGESAGLLPETSAWSATSLPTISIGQGVSATLVQVMQVFSTIANGGEWVQPALVRGHIGDDGRLVASPQPQRRRVVSERTAQQVARMLVGVVEGEGGTCVACAVAGYEVAGKTGTAQKPSETTRGYEPGAYVASFVGFAPANDPGLVVGVTLDEPRPVYYGGLTAGPTFREIMTFALNHRRVAPSDPNQPMPSPAPRPEVLTVSAPTTTQP